MNKIKLPGYDISIMRSSKIKKILDKNQKEKLVEDMSISSAKARINANINVNLIDILYKEYLQSTKRGYDKIFSELEKIDIDENKFESLINNNRRYDIITNGNVGSFMTDKFNIQMNTSRQSTNGMIYFIGTINNKGIWVNPYMRWDDNSVYIVKDKIFCFSDPVFTEDDEKIQVKFKAFYDIDAHKKCESYKINFEI